MWGAISFTFCAMLPFAKSCMSRYFLHAGMQVSTSTFLQNNFKKTQKLMKTVPQDKVLMTLVLEKIYFSQLEELSQNQKDRVSMKHNIKQKIS